MTEQSRLRIEIKRAFAVLLAVFGGVLLWMTHLGMTFFGEPLEGPAPYIVGVCFLLAGFYGIYDPTRIRRGQAGSGGVN